MSLPQVVLVDITGNPISADDQGDATAWPAWTDNHFWEVSGDEREALERAEVERITDLHDAPPPARDWEEGGPDDPFARAEAEDAWRAAGCPAEWPTPEEIAEYDRWQEQAEASRDFYRRHGSFGDWLEANSGPA
jgi:hypothetical protein